MKHLKQEYPHCDAGSLCPCVALWLPPVTLSSLYDLSAGNNYDVTFGRLNRNLRRMGLEVKSVVGPIETDGKTRMVHHGIINNVRCVLCPDCSTRADCHYYNYSYRQKIVSLLSMGPHSRGCECCCCSLCARLLSIAASAFHRELDFIRSLLQSLVREQRLR